MSTKRISEAILWTFVFVLSCCLLGKHAMATNQVDLMRLALEGGKLFSEEAGKLEDKLKKDPDDLSSRTMLLGYYGSKAFESKDARKERQKHVLWFIRNVPESEIAGTPYTGLDPMLDREVYDEAKKLWLKQVETRKNTATIGNAANFFLIYDRPVAEDLLRRAKALEPKNPKWPELLGHLYSLGISDKPAKTKKESALKSLTEVEAALNLTPEDRNKFYLLDRLAMNAFEAGELNKASKYASELLQKASQYKNDWNYGNAIHKGNLILGRIALRSGKLEEAKDYLLEAGKTPGSPQLDSFGPNMTLAKELLEKGEKKAVTDYFRQCGIFWKMGKDRLNHWMSTVEKGGIPDFGANLSY
jgi:hypothetical protein